MLGVIGDVVQDIVVWTKEEIRDATDTASDITITRGGSAANVAAFAGPRYPTRFIGCVGDDLAGIAVTADLKARGVDVRMQVRGSTGVIVVLIDADGERRMFPSRGASGQIERVDDEWLEGLEILHVTGYSLQGEPAAASVLDAARRVREAGGFVSFDVSSTGMIDQFGVDRFRSLIVDLAPNVISANRDETEYLGLTFNGEAGTFLARFPNTIVAARAGAEATRLYQGSALLAEVPVVPAETVRDLTGAGDAFNAGFLTALIEHRDPIEACERGHELARRVLKFPGASEG